MEKNHVKILLIAVALGLPLGSANAFWPTHGCKRPNKPGLLYWYGDTRTKKVALTFDDGPTEPYTAEILDILKADDVKATFFLLGKNAERYPELAQRIVHEGHAIGNHSFSHNNRRGKRELDLGEEAIVQATGQKPVLYRPPHGRMNGAMLREAQARGYVTVEWTVSPRDWKNPNDTIIAKRVLGNIRNGSIVLLHDGHPDNEKADRSHTVKALPSIIKELRERGYQLVTVPELLELPADAPALSAAR